MQSKQPIPPPGSLNIRAIPSIHSSASNQTLLPLTIHTSVTATATAHLRRRHPPGIQYLRNLTKSCSRITLSTAIRSFAVSPPIYTCGSRTSRLRLSGSTDYYNPTAVDSSFLKTRISSTTTEPLQTPQHLYHGFSRSSWCPRHGKQIRAIQVGPTWYVCRQDCRGYHLLTLPQESLPLERYTPCYPYSVQYLLLTCDYRAQ